MKVKAVGLKIGFVGLLAILLCFTCGSTAWAKVTGTPDACSFDLCHTMHGGGDNLLKLEYSGNQGCINCHSSDTSSTTYNLTDGVNTVIVPVVYYKGGTAPTDYLAGGNFWWVKEGKGGDDTKGHNTFLGEGDDYLSEAPGRLWPCSGACHDDLSIEAPEWRISFAGRQGCTGCHMLSKDYGEQLIPVKGYHHADDSETVVGSVEEDTDGYYRYLQAHVLATDRGVTGIEAPDWEANPNSGSHNEYKGHAGLNGPDSNYGLFLGESSMTGYCVGCHATIHREKDASGNWVRHPSDAVLLDSGYTIFNPLVPVARPDLTDWTGPSSTVTPGIDLAMCLSCHRAHGSPYPKMLRWDPTAAGSCAICHTAKVAETEGQYHVAEGCNVCHAAHGDGPPDFGPNENESLVAKVITTPSGDKNVTFPSGGASDYVSGGPDYNGICEVCHTQTSYYRNDGLGDEHPLYTAGVPVDPGWDCTACHSHRNEFSDTVNQIHATHFVSDQGPLFPQNETGCYYCHANGRLQCQEAPVFADSNSLADTTVCDSCHSAGGP